MTLLYREPSQLDYLLGLRRSLFSILITCSATGILITRSLQLTRGRKNLGSRVALLHATRNVFARLERFCACNRNPCLIVPILWGHEIDIYPDSLQNWQPVLKLSKYFQLKLSGIFQMISRRFQNCLDSSKTLITHYLAWEANTRFLGLSCETVSGGFRKVFTRKKCYLDSFGFLPLWPRGKRVRCIWRTSRRWLLFLVLRWTIEVKEAAPVCCSQKLLSLFHLLQGVNDKSFFR